MNIIRTKSNPDYNRIKLDVEYNHAQKQLLVKSGTFRVSGLDYNLADDEVIDIPEVGYHVDYFIHLVELESGDVRVMSDKVSDFDPPLNFNTSSLKNFGAIAILKYENGTKDEPDITVYQIDQFNDNDDAEKEIMGFYQKIGLVG